MPSPGQTKPTAVRVLLVLGSIFLCVGLIIAATIMGNPYFAVAQVALFCLIVLLTGFQLWRCFQAAKGTAYATTLMTVTFFLLMAILAGAQRLGDVFVSENRDYVRAATDPMVYVALVMALGLIETLLKNPGVKASDRAIADSLSADVKSLADTPDGKIQAIALHREQTGTGLAEAKDAVEKYLAARGG